MAHKIREALASEDNGATVSGEVEIDGAYLGGYVNQLITRSIAVSAVLLRNQNGKRSVVVIMRERDGRTLKFVSSKKMLGW